MTIKFYKLKSHLMAFQYKGSGDDLEAVRLMVAPIFVTVNFDNELVIDPDGMPRVVGKDEWVIKAINGAIQITDDKSFQATYQEM